MASNVSYILESTGRVDLDNTGTPRPVGLVQYIDGESTAGDGSYRNARFFPIYLDKRGTTDLSAPANTQLASALPFGMYGGTLVTLNGTTYLELAPDDRGPASEVWKFHGDGAQMICRFKLKREVVQPIAE